MKTMNGRVIDFEEIWQEGIRDWEGNLPKRMVDDESEEDFWKGLVERKKERYEPDPYARKMLEAILPELKESDSVLEIGPGWGNYTFSLAEKVKHMTVVDSSQAILNYLEKHAKEKKIEPFETIHAKWEQFTSREEYDVIFGVNCFYRMFEIKHALSLMNRYANRLVMIGMTTGPLQSHYLELERKFGYELKHPRRDYVYLIHLLYELGIYADCKIIPLKRQYTFKTYEELLEKSTSKVLDDSIKREHLEECLAPYIQVENDHYVYDHHFHGALISWKPTKM